MVKECGHRLVAVERVSSGLKWLEASSSRRIVVDSNFLALALGRTEGAIMVRCKVSVSNINDDWAEKSNM